MTDGKEAQQIGTAGEIEMPEAVASDESELAKELARFPADYIYYRTLLRKCTKKFQIAKLELATIDARFFARHREKLSGSSKEPSVASIRAGVEAEPEYVEHKRNEIDCEAGLNAAQTMVDAMEHKASMLAILGNLQSSKQEKKCSCK